MAYSAIGGFPSQQLSFSRKKLETDETLDPHRKYENHMFIVYMHVNKVNGHVYIGITHHTNPYRRWGYGGDKYLHCVKFMHAIQKYGWKNFEHIVLCKTSKDRAILIEQTLISHYKKLGICYNIANGGEGAEAMSEETKQKLKKIKSKHPAMQGRHHTPEARAKISEAGRNRVMKPSTRQLLEEKVWSKRRNVPIIRSKESIRKQAEKTSMAVLQLDLNGNALREFPSTRVADEFINNGKRHNHIADVCNGKRKTAGGYMWKYKEERRAV